MTKETVLPKLKTIIEPYVENQENFQNITMKTDFIKDLEINSANLVDIILDVEDEFGIVIDNEGMQKMITIEDSLAVILEKIKSN